MKRDIHDALLEVSTVEFTCHRCHYTNKVVDSYKFQDYYKDHFEMLKKQCVELQRKYMEARDLLYKIKGTIEYDLKEWNIE